MAYETAGLLLDHGWIRVLGSGGQHMSGSLVTWNALADRPTQKPTGLLIVAHDVLGGVFALDGGALGAGVGEAFYFAPR